MKTYAAISGGKDSLAALVTHIERGGRCDGAIYCRIMFDRETSAEIPEHEEWLHEKCFPLLERDYALLPFSVCDGLLVYLRVVPPYPYSPTFP